MHLGNTSNNAPRNAGYLVSIALLIPPLFILAGILSLSLAASSLF